ncbi:hypothetical protein BST97_01590 [Nonlabens spongiae]|uniref:DUF2141 domain-containing protein n=1 Tax=Nonlabens spongiae TaxID=331648 RepID=A0A1W6MGR3_9FLAO|nr:DUF2141 domain-containing protein [Nonlabens spongiae]ARN76798.1 hypothetical protein BST97_01590 [Nonlabens spongiae]
MIASKFYRTLFLIGTFSVLAFAKAYSQNTLTLELEGIEKQKGTLYLSLFNSKNGFPDDGKKGVESRKMTVLGSSVTITFENLPDGFYAAAYYQDVNDNGELDKNFFGIPREPVGASNMDSLGQPKFDKCKFEVRGDKVVKIVFMD